MAVGQHQNAGIGFGDGFLRGIGVFFFNNRHHAPVLADDASVAGGIGQHIGEQADFVAGGIEQGLQGGGVNQRHVAVEHQRAAVGGQLRQRGFQRVTGAQLLGLLHPCHIAPHHVAHRVFAVADYHADVLRLERQRGVDHAIEHGLAADAVQHFGQRRIHARAFAGGKDNDGKRGRHGKSFSI